MKLLCFAVTLCLLSFLYSCGNATNHKEKANAYSTTDSTSITGLAGDVLKLVKTASINIKVKAVEQSVRDVAVLAQKGAAC